MAPKNGAPREVTRGNSTIVTGARLLGVVAGFDGPAPLTKIAERADMSASRAYRYLRGLVDSGLVEQDPASGRYDLGPEVLNLGLAAISRIDPVRYAFGALPALTEATGLVSVISVWGSHGPTVIRCEHANLTAPLRIPEGIVLPLLQTAAGNLFLAHLPEGETAALLAREMEEWNAAHGAKDRMTEAHVRQIVAAVRKAGIARAIAVRHATHANLAAPVFDRDGKLSLAITLIGVNGSFDTALNGMPARELKAAAAAVSARLGFKESA